MSANQTMLKDRDGKEHKWDLAYYPAGPGLDLFAEIGPVIAPVLGAAADYVDGGRMSPEAIASAASGMFSSLLRAGGHELVLRVLSGARRDGMAIDAGLFNQAFAGNYGEAARGVWAMIRHNYESFTGGFDFAGMSERIKAADPATTPSAP